MKYDNPKLRVLNISHADFDGCTSTIVLKNYYEKVISVPVTYQSEERVVAEALEHNKNNFDVIICTDFYPALTIGKLRSAAETLVLDHHETAEKYNDNMSIVINTTMCGAKLTYDFVSKMKDVSYLKELVDITNDWDMYVLKDIRSKFYNDLYWEMGHKWFLRRFCNGNIKLYPEEKQCLMDIKQEFADMYESLEISELTDNGIFFETDRFMNDCVERLKKEGYRWFVIKNKNALSIRTVDIDLTKVFKILGVGGGHRFAGGVPVKYGDDLGLLLNRLQHAVEAVNGDD